MKILSIGNSFSVDTMEHIASIATALGITDFRFGNLYIGGCSINRHYNNAVNNLADYVYYTNTGNGWSKTENTSIASAVLDDDWDIISIQHGTGDKSRYTSPESYENLLPLIDKVKALCKKTPKFAFNMAWVAEPESTHHEITSYGGNQLLMYEKLTELTKNVVAPLVDFVIPTGTAVQIARRYIDKKLTRDDFHLSYDLGRYIAGITFLKALCDIDIDALSWCPEGVSEQERERAKSSALAAFKNPFDTEAI